MSYIDDDKETVIIPAYNSLEAAIEAEGFDIQITRQTPEQCSCKRKGCTYDTGHAFTHYRLVRRGK